MKSYEQQAKELDEAEEAEMKALLDISEAVKDEDAYEMVGCRYGFSGDRCNWESLNFCGADGRRCDHCPE